MLRPVRSATSSEGSRAARWIVVGIALLGLAACIGFAVNATRPSSDPAKIRLQATRAAQAGQWTVAETQLNRLKAPNPSDWLLRAIVSHNLKHLDAAEEALRQVPADGSLAAQAALWKGRVELSRFRARPMEQALRQALDLDPKLAEARRLLVYLYGTQDRRQDLLDQFAALVDTAPLTFGLINHWCIIHQDVFNEPIKLKKDLEKFVAADPDDHLSRMALAMNERKLTHYDRADAILGPLSDSNVDALACRAEVAFDRADYAAAERWLAKGPRDHAQLERLRGRLAARQGGRAAALEHFRRSDRLEPNQWETNYGLAQSLPPDDPAAAELKARRQSQLELEEMLTTLNHNKSPKIEICRKLATLCETSAYFPEARAWYRLAIALDPLHRQTHLALARLNAKANKPP